MGTYLFFSLLYHLCDSDSTQRRYSWKSFLLLSTLYIITSFCSHAEFGWRIHMQPGGQGAPLNRPHLLFSLISTSVSKHGHFLWPPDKMITSVTAYKKCKRIQLSLEECYHGIQCSVPILWNRNINQNDLQGPPGYPLRDKLGLTRIKIFSALRRSSQGPLTWSIQSVWPFGIIKSCLFNIKVMYLTSIRAV